MGFTQEEKKIIYDTLTMFNSWEIHTVYRASDLNVSLHIKGKVTSLLKEKWCIDKYRVLYDDRSVYIKLKNYDMKFLKRFYTEK
jgi:hypothetical protein